MINCIFYFLLNRIKYVINILIKIAFFFFYRFDDSVTVRWGVEVAVGSPVVTVSVLVPSKDGYMSLTGIPLQSPVQISLWLNEKDDIKTRTNPQCVHWSTARGYALK